MRSSRLAKAELIALLLGGLSPRGAVAEAGGGQHEPAQEAPSRPAHASALARTPLSFDGYSHWLGGLYVGRGLRFNNPYRLQTVLGDDAESLSLTATYLDLHLGRTFSAPDSFEHGVAAHLSIAVQGVRQEVLTPSYLLVKRINQRVLSYGRAGLPIVLEPDASLGLEAGLGGAYLLTANLGLGLELDVSLFYGAATIEEGVTLIPVMSLAMGVIFDWENLP